MLPILLYHRVVSAGMPLGKHKIWVRQKQMALQLKYLSDNGFKTLTFKELNKPEYKPQPKHIVLTFDDGYEDNYTVLFPLLKKYGFTAVIFMVTGTHINTWGIKEGEPEVPLMTPDMIREMATYGVEFGGHTHTHIDLSRADTEEVIHQLTANFNALTHILEYPPISFAYPFGGINDAAIQQVREAGYTYAVATNTGAINYIDNTFRIRRIEIRSHNSLRRFMYKASGLYFSHSYMSFLCKKLLNKI